MNKPIKKLKIKVKKLWWVVILLVLLLTGIVFLGVNQFNNQQTENAKVIKKYKETNQKLVSRNEYLTGKVQNLKRQNSDVIQQNSDLNQEVSNKIKLNSIVNQVFQQRFNYQNSANENLAKVDKFLSSQSEKTIFSDYQTQKNVSTTDVAIYDNSPESSTLKNLLVIVKYTSFDTVAFSKRSYHKIFQLQFDTKKNEIETAKTY